MMIINAWHTISDCLRRYQYILRQLFLKYFVDSTDFL